MAERFKLGKLPATRPYGLDFLSVYSSGKLAAPPAEVAEPKATYPLDGNGTYGDCVPCGVAHSIAAWNAKVKEADPVPGGDAVVTEYFKLTGGQDTGCNEASVLQVWRNQGLFGRKIRAYAPVKLGVVELQQAVAFYGVAFLGIACPESAQEQFQAGRPWTYVPGSPIEGGHCIIAVGYDQHYAYCPTWGGVAAVTWSFLARFLDEAWALIPNQFVEAGKGPELDLAALDADLDSLAA